MGSNEAHATDGGVLTRQYGTSRARFHDGASCTRVTSGEYLKHILTTPPPYLTSPHPRRPAPSTTTSPRFPSSLHPPNLQRPRHRPLPRRRLRLLRSLLAPLHKGYVPSPSSSHSLTGTRSLAPEPHFSGSSSLTLRLFALQQSSDTSPSKIERTVISSYARFVFKTPKIKPLHGSEERKATRGATKEGGGGTRALSFLYSMLLRKRRRLVIGSC